MCSPWRCRRARCRSRPACRSPAVSSNGATGTAPGTAVARAALLPTSDQVSIHYDPVRRAVWTQLRAAGRPSFNPVLLDELHAFAAALAGSGGKVVHDGVAVPFEAVVQTSATPGVFNLGGDLALFADLVERRDLDALRRYGRTCVDVVHLVHTGYGVGATTVALVQGAALGGGFEAALANEIVVAERQATFGFPEIKFNLFPGMGAYSFVLRRAGRRVADDLITTGRTGSAEEMHALGLVDHVVATGTGPQVVDDLLRARSRRRHGLTAIRAVSHLVDPVSHAELVAVVEHWARTAIGLGTSDLALMRRLARQQSALAAPS